MGGGVGLVDGGCVGGEVGGITGSDDWRAVGLGDGACVGGVIGGGSIGFAVDEGAFVGSSCVGATEVRTLSRGEPMVGMELVGIELGGGWGVLRVGPGVGAIKVAGGTTGAEVVVPNVGLPDEG